MGTSSDSATIVGSLDTTVPADNGTDGKRANGAAEIRQVKTALKTTFPSVTGAVTATHTELNHLDGVTGLSGSDTTLITGTAGTSGDLVIWDANGDAVDGPTPPSGAIVGTTDSQTLENKTLTSPTINGGNIDGVAIGQTNPSSGTFAGIINTSTLSQQSYAKLGDSADAPFIKTKLLVGTVGSVSSNTTVDTGVVLSQIVAVNVLVADEFGQLVPPHYSGASVATYEVVVTTGGDVQIQLGSGATSVAGNEYRVFIIYTTT